MPYDNAWIDALIWGGTILTSLVVVLWWEARQQRRRTRQRTEVLTHVRIVEPADLDHGGRVEKIGVDRHAPRCVSGYCVCGKADLDAGVPA